MPLSDRFIIIIYCFIALTLLSADAHSQTVVPDSLLYQKWDEYELEYQSEPWTPGCDSLTHHYYYPGQTFYYNVDSFYHLVATRNPDEIIEEIWYYYFILDNLNKNEVSQIWRDKLMKATKHYRSKALERELDVLNTYCYFIPSEPQNSKDWDFFWKLIEKYERIGDPQTKLRIMERLLYGCTGFPTLLVSTRIEKEQIPVLKLINEILSTLERMDGEPYLLAPGYFYCHIGLIYYDFRYYSKAIPLLWKAAGLQPGHYYDRSVMRARDYLGNYYAMEGNYDRSDSLYISILQSPKKIFKRPIDNVVAIGALAANANLRGNKEEALRLYSIILPEALQVKDSTLAGGYALHLGRLFMEKGETDKTGEMIDAAREYLLAGDLPIRNWERFYTLSCDYNLKINKVDRAARYIDSISMIRTQEENIYNARILAYAEQETFEMERILKEEQLRKQRSLVILITIILALSLLLLGVLFYYYRKLQEKNRDLFLRIKEHDSAAAWHQKLLFGGIPLSGDDELSGDIQKRELFVRVREYLMIDKNFTKTDIDINTLIVELSTNRTYLYEVIKSFTGKTFQEYINSLRMEEAKHLLETTDNLIENIAMICGYTSIRTFYRLFRSYYNISPTVYRKIAREHNRGTIKN